MPTTVTRSVYCIIFFSILSFSVRRNHSWDDVLCNFNFSRLCQRDCTDPEFTKSPSEISTQSPSFENLTPTDTFESNNFVTPVVASVQVLMLVTLIITLKIYRSKKQEYKKKIEYAVGLMDENLVSKNKENIHEDDELRKGL